MPVSDGVKKMFFLHNTCTLAASFPGDIGGGGYSIYCLALFPFLLGPPSLFSSSPLLPSLYLPQPLPTYIPQCSLVFPLSSSSLPVASSRSPGWHGGSSLMMMLTHCSHWCSTHWCSAHCWCSLEAVFLEQCIKLQKW